MLVLLRKCLLAGVLGALIPAVHGLVPAFLPMPEIKAAAATTNDPPAFMGASRQFTLIRPVKKAPFKTLVGHDGKPYDLASLKGKVVLVNFWATWCAPCIVEMPTLDKLQSEMGGPDFAVLTISIDRRTDRVAPFWKAKGYQHIPLVLDPKSTNFFAFGGRGLPTSYLIDHRGMIVGYLEGHADWTSGKAKALIRFYLRRARKSSKTDG